VRGFGYWQWQTKAADRRLAREDRGAQLVEFAVALPLLVVFVVGIFDFSGAFTLKQKLTNVARDAARAAAADPSNDVSVGAVAPPPVSVAAAFHVVNNYFVANNLNRCGLSSVPTSSGLTWTYKGTTGGCPPGPPRGLTIIINRGYYFPASDAVTIANVSCTPQSAGSQTAVLSTCVSIQYAYRWRFGQVASLLGSSAVLPRTIMATGVAMNEN
jgi:Flp pilus assembly pilin Flp